MGFVPHELVNPYDLKVTAAYNRSNRHEPFEARDFLRANILPDLTQVKQAYRLD